MTKLYEIAQDYSDVLEAITNLFDENPELDETSKQVIIDENPELDETSKQVIIDENLSGLQHSFESKSLALAGYILNLKLQQSNVKEIQDRFTKRARQLDKTITQLNDYLLQQMQQVNIPKLANSWVTIQIKTNPCKVIIDDETLLSDEFKTIEQVIKINKSAISEQLKAGQIIPYAHLEQSKRLEIK